jgi:hypothetical protein
MNIKKPNAVRQLEADLLAMVGQMMSLTLEQRKAVIVLFTELLRPRVMPPTILHGVLQEAAERAGLVPPSAKAHRRQHVAAHARKIQREEDLALRRVLVSYLFKQLRSGLRARPASLGTAQAIIGRLERLPFERKPPITVRTIQEDIHFMRKNGNFGI